MRGKISKLHEMLIKKEFSSKELTEAYLENIKKKNEVLNSYITVCEEEALFMASEADKRLKKGEEDVFLGIPFSLKDNISTKGIKTTCGSKMLCNYEPVYDAFSYEQLKNSGAVLLGKTNMDEFSMGSTCETSYFGPCRNPYDTFRVSGGSSGGSAVSVSADMAVFSLASDTGGSIRLPASFCGVVGLKPTYGAVSRNGLIAYASSLDQIGVLGSRAEDVSLVFDRISKKDTRDLTSKGSNPTFNSLKKSIKGTKIGIIKNLFDSSKAAEKILSAIEIFKALGCEISEISINSLDMALPSYYILASAEAASNLARYDGVRYGYRTASYKDIDEMILKSRSEAFGDEVKRRIMLGNYVLRSGFYEEYYNKARNARNIISLEFNKLFENYDILLSPVSLKTAFNIGEFKALSPVKMYETDLCCVAENLCGLPAVSIPCGFDKNGLPIGMQLIANKFKEDKLLNVSYAYEDARGEHYEL